MKHPLIIAISLLYTTLALAQTPPPTVLHADTSLTIPDVLCLGERMRYLTPSQTLRGTQLQSLSTSSVADALKFFSGVQIKDFGGLGGLKTVNVRSLGSQHVGVYLDGIRITNAQNGQVDLGKFSLTNMESVSLCNANKSERLQSASEYASGATIYLQTKTPTRNTLQAEYAHGSFGLNKLKAYAALANHAFLDCEWQHSDGDYKFSFHSEYEDTTGRRHNGDITFFRIEAAAFWHNLKCHAYYYNSQRGLPGPVIRRLSEQYDSHDRQWDQNLFAQLSYQTLLANTNIRLNAKYAYDYLHYIQDPSQNAATMYVNNKYIQQDAYSSIALAHDFAHLISLTASADFRWSNLSCNVHNFNYVYRLDTKALLSAIAQYHGIECNIALLLTRVNDHTRNHAKPLTKLSPMVSASYKHGPWVWRAFHKRIFRTPTLNDLYYTLVGNSNLKPEYATQWDLGVDFHNEHLHFAIDIYHNEIDNKIVAVPARFQFRWSMMNFGHVISNGISTSAGYDTALGNVNLHSNINYTFQRDIDHTNPSAPEYGNFIPYSPQHSASAILDISLHSLSLSAAYLYTGERFCLVSNNHRDLLDPWHTIDLKLSKTLPLNNISLQLSGECNNLTDSRHEVVKRYPMPSRNFNISIKLYI